MRVRRGQGLHYAGGERVRAAQVGAATQAPRRRRRILDEPHLRNRLDDERRRSVFVDRLLGRPRYDPESAVIGAGVPRRFCAMSVFARRRRLTLEPNGG